MCLLCIETFLRSIRQNTSTLYQNKNRNNIITSTLFLLCFLGYRSKVLVFYEFIRHSIPATLALSFLTLPLTTWTGSYPSKIFR
jgi:hypothetical protein